MCWACPFDAVILPGLIFVVAYDPDPATPTPPIIVLPTEGIGGIPDNPQRAALKFIGPKFMAGDHRWAEKVAAYCLWGKQQLIGFEQYAPKLVDRCFIIGHPRFDRRCIAHPPACRRTDERVRIGIVTRFPLINPFDRRSNLMTIRNSRRSTYHHLQQAGSILDIEDLYFTQVSDLRVVFDVIDRLDPARHELLLRVHPREDRTVWEEIVDQYSLPVAIAPWDQPFIHWLDNVDWLVAPPSTSFYDSFFMRKPAICLDAIEPRRKDHILRISDDTSRILEYALRPRTLDELLTIVSRKPTGPLDLPQGVIDLLAHDANYPACLNALDALADVCVRVLKKAPVRTSPLDQLIFRTIALRYKLGRRRFPDQGSSFRLDRKRCHWIDSLAAQ
jgi:surface carbohydrate biosynthesis protein